jgi:NhaP-type Na+/H+ or K+/H+ antiporter
VLAGLIYALIPDLTFLSNLACLTPNDLILAAAVVGGKYADKHVPVHLCHLLAVESGCNDGAAYPFLYIVLYLILDSTTSRAVEGWLLYNTRHRLFRKPFSVAISDPQAIFV